MKIYQKLCFNILMKPAKNQKKIPSNFFFMAPVTPQTFQCLLVPDPKKCLKLYRGVGVGGCLGRPRYPYSVPDVGSDPRTDRPALPPARPPAEVFRRRFRRSVLLPFLDFFGHGYFEALGGGTFGGQTKYRDVPMVIVSTRA
jgi:hypothetical protein